MKNNSVTINLKSHTFGGLQSLKNCLTISVSKPLIPKALYWYFQSTRESLATCGLTGILNSDNKAFVTAQFF